MLATAERLHPEGPLAVVETIWHRPADPAACDGDCDYHPIACGEPGISVPGGLREVPDVLSDPGQRWCTACRPDMTRGTAATGCLTGELRLFATRADLLDAGLRESWRAGRLTGPVVEVSTVEAASLNAFERSLA